MCAQLRIRKHKVSQQAASEYLGKKQRKRLDRDGVLTIDLPDDRHQQQRMRLALGGTYVS